MTNGAVLGRGAGARTFGVLGFAALAVVGAAIGAVGCGSATGPIGGTSAGAAGETAAESGQAGMADETPAGAGEGGSGGLGEAGAGATGETGDAGAAAVLDAPWNEHSQHVELDCFDYLNGSLLFEADRAELSPEQLRLFDGLKLAESNDRCAQDELGCGFAITDDRGEVTLYAADAFDSFCGVAPALSYASVAPLLDGLGCQLALDDKKPLAASTGCFHGVQAGASAAVLHQPLSLSEAHRSYHVELVHCLSGMATLELLGADPGVPLAVSRPPESPGPRGACASFDVEVQTPITADLVIRTSEANFSEFYLNFR